jgi:4-hydroxybenzoate polyprenyltransferase
MWFMAVTVTLLQLGLKQPTSIIYMGLYALLLVAYSSPHIKLQARGILASIVLSVCYGTLPLFLGWTQQRTPNLQFYVLAALLIMLMLPSLLAKDYKDLVGDRKTGKNTLLVRHGPTVVMRVSALILILAFITSVLAYFQFNWPPVIILLVVVYSLCVSILHHKRGKTGGYFLRLPQLLVLIISWLILQHIAH